MDNQKLLLINVLSPEAYKDCHIPGSINIPVAQIQQKANLLDKNTEIIVYCAHAECPASKHAWHILRDLGFTNIRAYEGGMREWLQLGYPIEGACTQEYLKVPAKDVISTDPDVKTISAAELREKLTREQ